jgi:hypothetical protein
MDRHPSDPGHTRTAPACLRSRTTGWVVCAVMLLAQGTASAEEDAGLTRELITAPGPFPCSGTVQVALTPAVNFSAAGRSESLALAMGVGLPWRTGLQLSVPLLFDDGTHLTSPALGFVFSPTLRWGNSWAVPVIAGVSVSLGKPTMPGQVSEDKRPFVMPILAVGLAHLPTGLMLMGSIGAVDAIWSPPRSPLSLRVELAYLQAIVDGQSLMGTAALGFHPSWLRGVSIQLFGSRSFSAEKATNGISIGCRFTLWGKRRPEHTQDLETQHD